MPSCRIPPIAYALLLIAGICIYGIILNPAATFAGMDFQNLNYPRVSQVKHFLESGHIPLWNWHEWGGAPLLAPAQGAVFYPPNWLTMLLPLPFGLQVFIFLHILTAGIGAALLARALFMAETGICILAGILYMGNAFFSGRIEQFQIIAVNCLLPWLILTAIGIIRDHRSIVPFTIVWSFHLLAGHPQYAAFNLIAAGIIGVTFALQQQGWPKVVVRFGMALLMGSCLAAIQLLPTLELSSLSERIWPYPDPTAPELAWSHLPAIIVPRYYNLITGEIGRVFGYTELGLYAGVLAFPLAAWGVIYYLRKKQITAVGSAVIVLGVLWVGSMIFALGRHAIIAEVVYNYFPFFKQSRGAARSLNIASLCLAILGALGAQQLCGLIALRLNRPLKLITGLVVGLCLLDISTNQYPVVKSVLTPKTALTPAPLFSVGQLSSASPAGRIYRFSGTDSDIYLNNTPAAVMERQLRLQPNLAAADQIGQLDGYEEGLLPIRARANLSRMLNRNFRDDSPDAPLLALFGANLMFTEFPLPENANWTTIYGPITRPSLVPSVTDGPATYQILTSKYTVKSLALDGTTTTSRSSLSEIVDRFGKGIAAANLPVKIPPSRERAALPLDEITPEDFVRAQSNFVASETGTDYNAFNFHSSQATSQTLLLFAPYPGWKPERSSANATLSAVSPVLYKYTATTPLSGQTQKVVFSPFSFRLGMFISLGAMITVLMLDFRSRKRFPLSPSLNTNSNEL